MFEGIRKAVRSRKFVAALVFGLLTSPAHAATQVTYYHTDGLGSVVMESSESGQVTYNSEYRPYGEQVLDAAKAGPGFTGHVSDVATGLTYMQQRYYDATIGRFLSVDPVTANSGTGADFNRYSYANNNPYKFTDPDGRRSRELEYEYKQSGATPPPKSPDDKLGTAIGAALTAVVAAPIAAEIALAALANPGAVATATNIAAEAAGVTGTAGASALAAKEINALVTAANKPYNSTGLSVAARKLEQHATRPNGTFSAPTGTVAQKNEVASNAIQGILSNPDTVRTGLSRGGVEFRAPNGQGVRFEADGAFDTFLDPKR